MSSWTRKTRKVLHSARFDAKGNVAIFFGLCLFPTLGLIGLAVDYSSASTLKRRLDAAADAAILNAVSRSSNPNLDQPSSDQIKSAFYASVGRAPNLTVSDVTITPNYVNGSLQVKLSYQATMQTSFGSLFNVANIGLSGTATSSASLPPYANFYLLLDNSPSMGLGATTADIAALQKVNNGCAFACHQHTYANGVSGDNQSDSYHIAKSAGVKTRIDVVRSASQQVFDIAQSLQKTPGRYQAAVYAFSDVLQLIAPLSTDLATTQSKTANIDLAYAYHDQRNTQTAYDTAFSYMTSIVGTGGDGQTSSSPVKYLLMVTDGVEDEPVNNGSGSKDQSEKWAPPNQTTTSPPSDAYPNVANSLAGNVSAGGYIRLITSLNPSICDALKANNVKIAILHTTYLPVTTDSTYNTYVAPIASQVPQALQKCASPNLFFTVDPSQDISSAMSTMFRAVAVGQPRLTH